MEPGVSSDMPDRSVHRSAVFLHVVCGRAGVPDLRGESGSGDHILQNGDGSVLLATHGAEVSNRVCGSKL